jgi:hypothetical protein
LWFWWVLSVPAGLWRSLLLSSWCFELTSFSVRTHFRLKIFSEMFFVWVLVVSGWFWWVLVSSGGF